MYCVCYTRYEERAIAAERKIAELSGLVQQLASALPRGASSTTTASTGANTDKDAAASTLLVQLEVDNRRQHTPYSLVIFFVHFQSASLSDTPCMLG